MRSTRLLGLIAALALSACAGAGPRASSAQDYVDEYGGSLSAYQEILELDRCRDLQAAFDTAAANNDAAAPGTPAHRASLGFMRAALDRMDAQDCS